MINPRDFRRHKSQSRLHLKIRLVKRGSRPTEQETIDALDEILETGQEPEGWEFYVVNYAHPNRSGTGGISDLQNFRAAIGAMRDDLRFAFVRR